MPYLMANRRRQTDRPTLGRLAAAGLLLVSAAACSLVSDREPASAAVPSWATL